LRNLRIPIPKTLDHTLCRAYLKPFGRKLLFKPHWAPGLVFGCSRTDRALGKAKWPCSTYERSWR